MTMYQVNIGQPEAIIVMAANAAAAIVIVAQALGLVPAFAIARPI